MNNERGEDWKELKTFLPQRWLTSEEEGEVSVKELEQVHIKD